MSHKKSPSRYTDVIRVFGMVHGFSGMLTLSVIIKAANKLSTISLALTIALLIARAVTHTVGSLAWWAIVMGLILLAIFRCECRRNNLPQSRCNRCSRLYIRGYRRSTGKN